MKMMLILISLFLASCSMSSANQGMPGLLAYCYKNVTYVSVGGPFSSITLAVDDNGRPLRCN
jgi:hypothetical protein